MMRKIVNADDVTGVDVKNTQGDNLGEVKAIMIDKLSGQVAYVVLSYGGFLGLGDKLFALPWKIFSYDNTEDCFKLSLSEEKLKNSPGFDKDNWPDMSSPTWIDAIHKYYGTNDHDHH